MEYVKKAFGREYFLVSLITLCGIAISIWLGHSQKEYYRLKAVNEFRIVAKDRVDVISDAINKNIAIMNSLKAFYDASDDVDDDEFHTFTSQMMKDNPFIYAISWLPRIENDARQSFEADKSLTIKDLQPDKSLQVADREEYYYPLLYVNPPEIGDGIMGINVNSLPLRPETIKRAETSGRIAATGKIKFLQKTGNNDGIIMFTPVYKSRDNVKKIEGMLTVAMPLDQMIRNAISPLSESGVHVLIYDESTDIKENDPLYIFPSRLAPASAQEIVREFLKNPQLNYTGIVNFADRKWRITIIPANGYYTTKIFLNDYIFTLLGLGFTLMMTVFLINRVGYSRKITEKVNEKTQQLSEAKSKIESILNSSSDAVLGVDRQGKITFANPMVTTLLLYTRSEIIGTDCHQLLGNIQKEINEDNAYDNILNTINNNVLTKERDVTVFRKDGKCMSVDYICSPAVDENGNVTGAVLIIHDIAEKKRYERRLIKLASYDHLTGLANRSLFMDLLGKAISRSARTGGKVGVIYMDLNDFKPVNDRLGHAAGDELLKLVAAKIKNSLRQYDTLARLGGDEFVIIADNILDINGLVVLIDRIISLLTEPFNVIGNEVLIGASIGAAMYPDDSTDIDTLISHADSAMYISKKDKSKSYVLFGRE